MVSHSTPHKSKAITHLLRGRDFGVNTIYTDNELNVDLHGVAIALVPGADENTVKIVCTTIAVNTISRNKFREIEKLSFKESVDLRDTRQVFDCFKRLVGIIGHVVTIQMRNCENVEREYREVSIMAGKDSRHDFDWGMLHALLMDREGTVNRGVDLEGKDHPTRVREINRVHSANKGLKFVADLNASELEELKSIYAKLSMILKKCYFRQGNYKGVDKKELATQAILEEISSDDFNEQLRGLKIRLDAGDEDALFALIELARVEAKKQAEETQFNPYYFKQRAPWDDYTNRPDLQERFPCYCFTSWHPDIEDAFIAEYKSILAITGNKLFDHALDPRGTLFTAPCHEMILDQIDLLLGRKTEDDIKEKDKTSWRKALSKSSYALCKNSNEVTGRC